MNPVRFIIDNNNSYYKLEAGKNLLNFIEFDFSFFWEHCIEAGKTGHKTGLLPAQTLGEARNAVIKCHPYVEACAGTSFDGIVIDCIIAYICSNEKIGLEELWARCISPKNSYETALFKRISEYKTGRAVNQWINIVRVSEYAKKKLDFIYDSKAGNPPSAETRKKRKEYFDLAFSLAANEMGLRSEDMPYVRKYNPSLAPESAFRLGKFSKYVYKSITPMLEKMPVSDSKHPAGVKAEQLAMDAFSYIKDIERPDPVEMFRAARADDDENSEDLSIVYMPSGFKGIIDLEFDLLEESGEYIGKCASCGRYYVNDGSYERPYCRRVNSAGITCRAADRENELMKKDAEEKSRKAKEEAEKVAEKAKEDAKKAEEEARRIKEAASKPPVIIPDELERRSSAVEYNLSRSGKMTRSEFEEWEGYLYNLKDNIRNRDGTIRQLEEFLSSAERLYEEIVRGEYDKEIKKAAPVVNRKRTVSDAKEYVPESFSSDSEPKKFVPPVIERPKFKEPESTKPPEEKITDDGRKYTPFAPKKYASLYDAMNDPSVGNMGNSPTLGDIMGLTGLADTKKDTFEMSEKMNSALNKKAKEILPARVIRKPEWEVLKYGKDNQ